MRTILDTGPIVALLNGRDRHHQWTLEVLAGLTPPLWTCEPVLTEAAHLTGRASDLLAMLGEGTLRIGIEVEEQGSGIRKLLDRYGRRMDLADACIVRMSEMHRRSQVLTLDRRDFSIYRRNGRDVIPLLAPPG